MRRIMVQVLVVMTVLGVMSAVALAERPPRLTESIMERPPRLTESPF